jgi:hypothetical protein
MARAPVFRSGNSQAVRLSKQFRSKARTRTFCLERRNHSAGKEGAVDVIYRRWPELELQYSTRLQ